MKNLLIIFALVVVAAVVVLGSFSDDADVPALPEDPNAPWFEVRVVKPRANRPLFGLLPDGLFGSPRAVMRFDLSSAGARVDDADPHRIEFRADGWELLLEVDDSGRVTPGSRLVVPMDLGGRQLDLRCRREDEAPGYLSITSSTDSAGLDGEFRVEFAICENAESGKRVDWPSSALSVRGSFVNLTAGGR